MTKPFTFLRLASGLALAAAIAFPLAARADERDHCRNTIDRDEQRVQWAIFNHGHDSLEAQISRDRLNEARQRCWDEFHVWWNGRDSSWHEVNDWEDYDRRH